MTTRGFVLSMALLGLPAAGLATSPPLIKPTTKQGLVKPDPDRAVLQSRRVVVDIATLRGPANLKFSLPLFGHDVVLIDRDRQETPRPGTLLWYGHVDGEPGTMALLSSVGDAVAGDVTTRDHAGRFRFYQLRFLGDGVHVLNEIDQSLLPPEDDSIMRDTGPGQPVAQSCDPASTIDVLVAYSGRARFAAGNTKPGSAANGMEAEIEEAVGSTNTSYANSGITQRLRLVHMEEVVYDEVGKTPKQILEALTGGSDGLDTVHQLRDQYGADVVAFIVASLSACGRSNVMFKKSAGFESQAFAVVRRNCSVTSLSFGHELGHVMGARHEWGVDGPGNYPQDVPSNHGYVPSAPGGSGAPWRTIMGVDENCLKSPPVNCSARLPYWSNPLVKYPDPSGDAMGIEGGPQPSDNHSRLQDTAAIVANFRCSLPSAGGP
jgi:hypothetical protein